MKCLHFFRVVSATSGISVKRGVQTGIVFLARAKTKVRVPRRIDYEPGIRYKEAAVGEDVEYSEDCAVEEDCGQDFDFESIDRVYDIEKDEQRRDKEKLRRIITAKKFFRSPPQPMTLTCNERECIRYLHKSDPTQWNVKALSEGFPATPEAIKKVLRGKFRLTPEQRQKYDRKVQRNWELLAQGQLDAEPEVLEHLKRFVNRREVLLEQIKSAKFYLPEVKEEPVWNNGEMSGILAHYEKAVQKLVQKQEQRSAGLLTDGLEKKPKSDIEKVREEIEKFRSERDTTGIDSFSLGGMINAYSNPVTLSDLEKKLLLKANSGKPLRVTEKAILESVLGAKTESHYTEPPREDITTERKSSSVEIVRQKEQFDLSPSNVRLSRRNAYADKRKLEKIMMNERQKEIVLPDSRTKYVQSEELGSFLDNMNKPKADTPRKEIVPPDPEAIKAEEEYLASQVKDIEKTSFWGDPRTSQEKALAEKEKAPLGGPDIFGRGNVFNSDAYPERIKIPKGKKGSGLTFKVKDCFYDDDGEFLYRVPGMTQ